MKGRKTLEINPEHPIVQALKDKVGSDEAGAKVRAPPELQEAVIQAYSIGSSHTSAQVHCSALAIMNTSSCRLKSAACADYLKSERGYFG